MATAKQNAIATADAELNNVALPTYTQVRAALNELAVYVKHGAASDALNASVARALNLAA